jgi:hypothetical protein
MEVKLAVRVSYLHNRREEISLDEVCEETRLIRSRRHRKNHLDGFPS